MRLKALKLEHFPAACPSEKQRRNRGDNRGRTATISVIKKQQSAVTPQYRGTRTVIVFHLTES